MTIYCDSIGHLVSDKSLEELHQFAHRIHLKREWFQNKANHPHYDLTTKNARNRAIQEGAILISSKELVQRLKKAPYQPYLL